jgi:glycine/D-amino acid oxidase-like deaminating enzyme
MAKAIVIGAGVIGCSIAYEMASKGYEVIAVDKAQGPGQGSTSASSAVVRFNYSTLDSVALAWESFHCWKKYKKTNYTNKNTSKTDLVLDIETG